MKMGISLIDLQITQITLVKITLLLLILINFVGPGKTKGMA